MKCTIAVFEALLAEIPAIQLKASGQYTDAHRNLDELDELDREHLVRDKFKSIFADG